jgi:hypothetical protein
VFVTIKVGVSMGLEGCVVEEEIEVEDEATEAQIESEVREWALQHVEWWRGAR